MEVLPSPRMLGRYALYGKIASGGMASVHLGRLMGPVGFARTVAIKRMHPQFTADAQFVSMFLDEARLAARVQHPNVVQTLDVVATEGELFLVMDFVHGESLSSLLRASSALGERIPPSIVAAIMVGVLHGLHAAHEAKDERGAPLDIVHRDVSPQNILVGLDGAPRVLDFGVATAVGRLQSTREGQLKGKLAYMAPEQFQGAATRASDIYSSAVVLWEALTATRLFLGNNDAHIMTMVLKGCSEPPSEVAPGISEALDLVVMRGLSVDPSRRFRTAGEMASALEEATDLATASKIGRWVNSVAGASLADRRTQVAAIESQSWVPPEDAVGLIRATGSVDALPLTETEGSSGGIPTQISGITAVPSPQAVATSMGPRTAEIVGLGSMAILASLTAFWMLRSSGASPPPRAASQPDFIAEPTPSSSAPVAVETASAPVPEPRPTASVSVAAPPPTPTATHPSPAHTPAPPARNCNPNFVMDREGNKLFKPECFRQ